MNLAYVVIFLWFAGPESASFRDVSDRFDIALSTLRKIVEKMIFFLSNLSSEIIQWPNNEEKQEIDSHFRHKGFPGVIGVIDGSHIRIDKPAEDAESYINRKYFYSVQMQVVCDHQRRIRDIFVGFPGSVHDSRVLRVSPLYDTLPQKCGEFFLLGDSGYPCLRHILTPFKDRGNLGQQQNNYNLQLARNRYVIKHSFGIMKQKFRQLYHQKLRKINEVANLIKACCVLHNLALNDNFPNQEEIMQQEAVEQERLVDGGADVDRDDRAGIEFRNQVARNLPRN